MYLRTVRGETRRPSFNSNSLAMRSSPQVGFSVAMRRISRRSSSGIGGRPGLDSTRQNRRQSKSRESNASDTRVVASMRLGLTPRSW